MLQRQSNCKGCEQLDLEIAVTDSQNSDFAKLIKLLDADLDKRNGQLQKQYNQFNRVDSIKDVVIIYKDKLPVACGAFKQYDSSTVEIKRMFVMKEHRQQGLAKRIIGKLEETAAKKGYRYALLETGIRQQEAIELYMKCGYGIISNYEPYIGNNNSVCMKKAL
jgi:putative acetyltransferase